MGAPRLPVHFAIDAAAAKVSSTGLIVGIVFVVFDGDCLADIAGELMDIAALIAGEMASGSSKAHDISLHSSRLRSTLTAS